MCDHKWTYSNLFTQGPSHRSQPIPQTHQNPLPPALFKPVELLSLWTRPGPFQTCSLDDPSHYPLSTERSSCFNSVVYSGKLAGSQLWKKQDLSFGCHSLKAVRYVLTICGCPCCNIIYKAEGDLRCLLGNKYQYPHKNLYSPSTWDQFLFLSKLNGIVSIPAHLNLNTQF